MADDKHSETQKTPKRIAYIYNEELIQQCNGLPKVPDRVRSLKKIGIIDQNREEHAESHEAVAKADMKTLKEQKHVFSRVRSLKKIGIIDQNREEHAESHEAVAKADMKTLKEQKHVFSRVRSLKKIGIIDQNREEHAESHEAVAKADMKTLKEQKHVFSRASMVHSLITAYDLLPHMRVISPRTVKDEDIELFHSPGYVECLRNLSQEDDAEKYDEEAEMYGLTYDCPAYPGVFEYAALVAGASVTAAQALMMRLVDVAINWTGGWHHAKRDEASGFCYLNDIVIAILKLRQKYDRVLYVDIDLHHGDGVEDAFCATNKVMTVSFHKSSPGFFPGTGKLTHVGMARGKYFTVNVPLKDGIQDEQYFNVFTRVMNQVKTKFEADAIVCQCGADGLANDPMVSYNLTPVALGRCVKYLMAWKKPMILLGGGGYNLANTARCWAYLTAVVLNKTLCDDIPEHKWFPQYGPDYDLNVQPGNRSNQNTIEYIDKVVETITENLSYIGS